MNLMKSELVQVLLKSISGSGLLELKNPTQSQSIFLYLEPEKFENVKTQEGINLRKNRTKYLTFTVLDEDLTPEDVIIQMRELRGPRAVQSVKQYNFINEFRELCHKAESLEYEDEGCVSR